MSNTINRASMLESLRQLYKLSPNLRQPQISQPMVKSAGVTILKTAQYYDDAMDFFRYLEQQGAVVITDTVTGSGHEITPTDKINTVTL